MGARQHAKRRRVDTPNHPCKRDQIHRNVEGLKHVSNNTSSRLHILDKGAECMYMNMYRHKILHMHTSFVLHISKHSKSCSKLPSRVQVTHTSIQSPPGSMYDKWWNDVIRMEVALLPWSLGDGKWWQLGTRLQHYSIYKKMKRCGGQIVIFGCLDCRDPCPVLPSMAVYISTTKPRDNSRPSTLYNTQHLVHVNVYKRRKCNSIYQRWLYINTQMYKLNDIQNPSYVRNVHPRSFAPSQIRHDRWSLQSQLGSRYL